LHYAKVENPYVIALKYIMLTQLMIRHIEWREIGRWSEPLTIAYLMRLYESAGTCHHAKRLLKWLLRENSKVPELINLINHVAVPAATSV
jgi:hypothetical protein